MARQPTQPIMVVSLYGQEFQFGGELARQMAAAYLESLFGPGATWEVFDDPPRAVPLAAEHLARRSGVARERIHGQFERIVAQACGRDLPRGPGLASLFAFSPLSWPERVFACEAIGDPPRFLDDEDLAALPARLAVTGVLIDPRTPLYSHRELGRLLAGFAAPQETTKDRLLRDGHATTAFARCPWLDVWLNKLYPTKLPIRVLVPSGPRPLGVPDGRYIEGRRLAVPLTQQEELRELSRSSGLLEGQQDQRHPVVQFAWGRRSDSIYTVCDYEAADSIAGLHEDDVEWLGSIGPVLHEFKNRVPLELSDALSSGTAARLWDRVAAVLAGRLDAEQVRRLLRLDARYLGYDALNGAIVPGRTPYVPGGFSTVVELAGYVEKGREVGTLDRTRAALGGLVVSDLLGRPWVGAGLSDPYWALAGARTASNGAPRSTFTPGWRAGRPSSGPASASVWPRRWTRRSRRSSPSRSSRSIAPSSSRYWNIRSSRWLVRSRTAR